MHHSNNRERRAGMDAGNWIGVAAIVVPVVGSVLGMGSRILQRLTRLETQFEEERTDRVQLAEKVDEHVHSRLHIRRA